MKKSKIKSLLKLTPETKARKVLEDLQYNLNAFLNEDVYLDHFDQPDSLYWVEFFVKNGLIFVTQTEKRLLLTPEGLTFLNEINSLLLYYN